MKYGNMAPIHHHGLGPLPEYGEGGVTPLHHQASLELVIVILGRHESRLAGAFIHYPHGVYLIEPQSYLNSERRKCLSNYDPTANTATRTSLLHPWRPAFAPTNVPFAPTAQTRSYTMSVPIVAVV